ncbi:MAG: Uma2 family endonuclease, partial [Candidatus Competibacteraceae bacterium]|nr:Uma2 family endonuclease [Candidatus Competibacteraceae bacterium]
MNQITRIVPETTQAAEGLPRRRWTLAEIEQLSEMGVFGGNDERPRERFELIGGEIVPMAAKGAWHESLKKDLNRYWVRRLPDDIDMAPETTVRTPPDGFLEPDFIFWPGAIPLTALNFQVSLLVVEIADSSLLFDTKRKAPLYAGFGVREYWVIDARRRRTTIHRDLADGAYRTVTTHAPTDILVPALVPALAVRLADLPT